ncbi:arginine--tRNA ligase [Vibrio chagasii]|nr:arginine--tRNA ligase [Vibrio chagasii]
MFRLNQVSFNGTHDLEGFYRESKKLYDEDEEFAVKARGYVVKLQSGDDSAQRCGKTLT